VGGSGTGKSVLLRAIVGLLEPNAGQIEVFGQSVRSTSDAEFRALRRRWGVMFQDGAVFSSLYTIIPTLLETFVERHPKVKFHLQELTVGQQLSALREDRIDVGILRGPVAYEEIETATIFEEPFVTVMSRKHSLAKENALNIEQIMREPLISLAATSSLNYRRQMFGALSNHMADLRIAHEVSDTHTLLGLVAAGMGISLVPASFSSIFTDQLVYRPLVGSTPKTTLQLAWRRESLTHTLGHLVSVVKSIDFGSREGRDR